MENILKCFKCGRFMGNRCSQYGWYYYCKNSGNKFETESQKEFNKEHFDNRNYSQK